MKRIAVIDRETHTLFVEDIDESILNEDYNGNVEDYIKDNYNLSDNWVWEHIVRTEYVPIDGDPIAVNFRDLL